MCLAACQAVCLVATVSLFLVLPLSFDWSAALPVLLVDVVIAATWLHVYRTPGTPADWLITETLFAFFLVLVLSHILGPAQYAAAALDRPLIDPLLAAADARLGVHVPTLASWLKQHALVNAVLTGAYFTVLGQFALAPAVLGLYLRNREALWEYTAHFHFCAIVTVVALAIFPAQCAFQHYGFQSTNQARFIRHFNGFRDGSLTVVRANDMEGLISMPSFHVAGALMVTWAFRRHWLVVPLLVVNTLLVAATFLSGAHYFVDVLATIGMFAVSVATYRVVGASLLRRGARKNARFHPRTGCEPEQTVATGAARSPGLSGVR